MKSRLSIYLTNKKNDQVDCSEITILLVSYHKLGQVGLQSLIKVNNFKFIAIKQKITDKMPRSYSGLSIMYVLPAENSSSIPPVCCFLLSIIGLVITYTLLYFRVQLYVITK